MNKHFSLREQFTYTKKVLVLVFVFVIAAGNFLYSQTAGDYRSASNGNWTTLSSWQRYNGSTWATPTVGQGYPGQLAGTGAVVIQAGHKITVGTGGLTTQPMGIVTIENTGQLYLTGANSTVTVSLNTLDLVVNSGGSIYFFNKVKLVMPENAVLFVTVGGLTYDICNNNKEIWIGTAKYAVCAGAPGSIFTFDQVMTGGNGTGGTLNSVPTSNSPVCVNGTINLTGNYTGAIGTAPTFSWRVTAPGGGVTTYSTQNASITPAVLGTYSATLTVSTVLNGTTYSNAQTISIIVNPLPTLSGATQQASVCDGSQAIINLTGLLPSTTFTLNYTINGVPQAAITGLVSGLTGTGSFSTVALTTANDGQTLQITGITVTSSASNCLQTFTQDVTLSVSADGSWTGLTSTDWNTASNWCGGIPTSTTDVIVNSTAPNQPIIGVAGGVCKNISINTGASLTIDGSNSLSVYGDWLNDGSFVPNTSTVTFSGTTAISGSSTNTFNNLSIAGSSSLTAPAGNININGNFSNSGTFTHNSGTITFSGTGAQSINSGGNSFNNLTITNIAGTCTAVSNNITIASNFTSSELSVLDMATFTLTVITVSHSGTLLTQNTSASPFTTGKSWGGLVNLNNSSSAQTAVSGTFNDLTISTPSGATASGDITVNGVLNLAATNPSATQGCLEMVTSYGDYPRNTATNTYVPITSYVLTMGDNATTVGQGDVTGKIYRSSITANTTYTFGNQFTSYSFTVAPSNVTVIVTIGTAYGDGSTWGYSSSVKRSYEMIPTGGDGARVTMNLHYLDSELNGNTESLLTTGDFDVDGAGAPLGDEHGRSSYDYTNNYIGLSGVSINYFIRNGAHDWYTIFNLRDYSADRMVWTGTQGSNNWTTEGNWYNVSTHQYVGYPGNATIIVIPDVTNDPIVQSDLTLGGVEILSGGSLNLNSKTITINAQNYNGWEDQSGISSNYTGSNVIFVLNTLGYSTPILGIPHFNNLTINTDAGVTVEPNSHIYISGTFTNNGSFDAGTFENTVEYNGAGQTVVLPDGTIQYHHLTLSGSGTKTLPTSDLTINGNFTLIGTVETSPTNALTINGNVDIGSGTTFTGGSLTHEVGGNWTNAGTFADAGSTIDFVGVDAGDIGASNFNNITFSGSGAKTATGILDIGGNVSITNNFVAGAYTHTVAGNWSNSGIFTATGSTINFDGTTSGNVGASDFNNIIFSGSGAKTATGILTIAGNVDISNNFTAGSFTHTVGGNWTNSGTYTDMGSTIDFNGNNTGDIGSSNFNNITFSGSGTKTATGILSIAANVNILNNFTAGSFTHTVGGNWVNSGTFTATGSTIDFNGAGAGNIGASNFNNISFTGAGAKTATGILAIDANVNISNNFTAGAYTHTVGGNWTNSGTFTATGSLIEFNGSGAGNIGASNFNDISFTGSGIKTAIGVLSISGNVNIANNFVSGSYTHTVGGNWLNSGTFTDTGSTIDFNGVGAGNIGASNFNNITLSGAGIKTAIGILSIAGNVDISGNFTAGAFTHKVGGNWSNSGTFTDAGSIIDFDGSGAGNVGASNFNDIICSGSGVKTAIGILTISGNITILDNFTAGNFSHAVGGNFSNFGSFTSGTSTFTFNGSNSQTIISGGDSFYNIVFNDATPGASDFSVTDPMSVTNSSTFTEGIVVLSGLGSICIENGATSTAGTETSFVDGAVKKVGNVEFTFPLGDNNLYAPLKISAADGGGSPTDDFTAKYINENPQSTYAGLEQGIDHVSYVEYWTLDRSGTNNVYVTLTWAARSAGITLIDSLIVARWDGSKWTNKGKSAFTGDLTAGTITSNLVTGFSPFTLGSKDSENPMPVELMSFYAECNSPVSTIKVNWSCASEINNDYFILEQSTDCNIWRQAGKVIGAGNSNNITSYFLLDNPVGINDYNDIVFYRLKQFDYDGKMTCSEIISVTGCKSMANSDNGFSVLPNPFRDEVRVEYFLTDSKNVDIIVSEISGKQLKKFSFNNDEGSVSHFINLSTLSPGIYILTFSDGTQKVHTKVIKY